ncbi:hypothetical protein BTGOE5_53030 [Bacillus thuringiensis]|nr:hypothetical protein IG5_04778 [Bacillus toyonensis]OFC93012.1 hypothetical protein BTGOE5_53030 [Bacillus thuringiensis]OQD24682.1 hypothetical protein B1K97_05486 [Bacillus toyonensis]
MLLCSISIFQGLALHKKVKYVLKGKSRHSSLILYASQKLRLFFTNFTQIIGILIYSDN